MFQITLVYFIQKRKNSRKLVGQLEKKNKLVVLKSFEPKLSKLKLISYLSQDVCLIKDKFSTQP